MSGRRAGWAAAAVALSLLAACGSDSVQAGDEIGTTAPATVSAAPTTAATPVAPSTTFPAPVTTESSTSTPAPPTTPAATTQPSTAPSAAACVARLPLAVRAGQVVWPSVAGDQLATAAQQYASWGVGGALLMTWPAGATGAQLQAFKRGGKIPLLISTDEEGGTVQRFRRVGVLPSASKVASTMSPAQAEQMIAAHAAELHALGVDVAFAPVVDVRPVEGQGPIGSRSFSSDPNVVSAYASAYVKGWESAGVLPVLKHFPGHGSASADSHTAEAVTPPLSQLRRRDLLPYTALRDSGAGAMVGHLTVPGLTDAEGVPASMSKAAYALLRHEYGDENALVFTDALGMDAVARLFTIPQAAERALESGADVVIYTEPGATSKVIAQLVAAVKAGRLPESRLDEAVGRVLRTKHVDPCSL